MTMAPRVSVIVPTRNRARSLGELFASLREQRFSDFEVVVVDDGSTDRTADVVNDAGIDRITCVAGEGVGAVAARCLGVKASTGEILAFTDDDCIVDPDWLERGVAAIDGGADVVQGSTDPQRALLPLERTVQHAANDGLFPTCNVFYRRAAYEAAGGFDRFAGDRLGFRTGVGARHLGFGEDTLLGWAVARQGTAAAAPDVRVRHDVVRPPIRELFSRTWVSGGFPALIREVPELRDTIVRNRVVLGRLEARHSVYGVALVLAGPFWILGLGSAVVWVGARARRMMHRPGPLMRRAIAFPVELALDVTMCVALVVGSVRARTALI